MFGALFDRFASTRRFFQFFPDFTVIAILEVFAEIADLVGALFDRFTSTRRFFFVDFTIIAILGVFAEIADLVGALFDRFTSTRRFFQFLAKIVIFAAELKPGHISTYV